MLQLHKYIQINHIQNNKQYMQSEDQQHSQQDDGFQSVTTEKHEQLQLMPENQLLDDRLKNSNHDNKQGDYAFPPGQAVMSMGKKYSLFPDIITGWIPRYNKCNPIPISVSAPALDTLFQQLLPKHYPSFAKYSVKEDQSIKDSENIFGSLQSKSNQMIVCYFGPRYDNTYFAWHQMPFQFPYTHIQPPNDMKLTNRPFIAQHPTLHHLQPNTLIFDSFYQSANLDCVIKVSQLQYDLYLRVDSNTRGHFQWYNFTVKNFTKGTKYRFNICNLQKDNSLYLRGMKPYMLSHKAKQKIDKTWVQDGQNIRYQKKMSKSLSYLYKNCQNLKGIKKKITNFYNLSFQYTSIYDQDIVQMAYCIPYTFTNLNNYLADKKKKCQNKKYYSEGRLCLSLGGLPVPIITINQQEGNLGDQQNRHCQININLKNQNGIFLNQTINPPNTNIMNEKKKCVVIGCRVHPGQSNSSYMMEGFLDFICSNKPLAKNLRSKILFKIVPMLNPDGVCFGNYRTGLSGKDFNRQYVNPDPRIFPQVYSFKKMILDHKKKYGNNFLMFLDFHGHSVRKNVFMYGPENSIMQKYYYQSRIFPRILSKRTDMFRYYSCIFKIEQEKKSTARSIFQKIHNIPLSYTIQASNGSYYNTQLLKDFPFTQKMWKQMGIQIGASLSQYVNVMIMAQIARQQKYKKITKYGTPKQQSNLRASKLIQRKKQKKKGGQKIEDFNYGRVLNSKEQKQYDQQLLKYIYEQIEKSENIKKNVKVDVKIDVKVEQQIKKAFQFQEKIVEGWSDKQSVQDDLQPQKLQVLHHLIKKKQYNESIIVKNQNKPEVPASIRPQKQFIQQKINLTSRARSAMSSNQQQYFKKLSQPKKKTQNIVNLFLQNSYYDSFYQPVKIFSIRQSKYTQFNKRNPKTFKDFVASYQKWSKNQKEIVRPASAFNASYTITQGSNSHQLNNKSTQSRERNRLLPYKSSLRISNKNETMSQFKQFQLYKKGKIYSPVKNRNISIN